METLSVRNLHIKFTSVSQNSFNLYYQFYLISHTEYPHITLLESALVMQRWLKSWSNLFRFSKSLKLLSNWFISTIMDVLQMCSFLHIVLESQFSFILTFNFYLTQRYAGYIKASQLFAISHNVPLPWIKTYRFLTKYRLFRKLP